LCKEREDLLGRADHALYQAGFLGGNRVVDLPDPDTFGLVRRSPQADGSPTVAPFGEFIDERALGRRCELSEPRQDRRSLPRLALGLCGRERKARPQHRRAVVRAGMGDCRGAEVVANDPVWLLEASKSS
jgi:hypothetical protein